MMYWSSLLVEEDLKALKSEVNEIQEKLQRGEFQVDNANTSSKKTPRPYIDEKLPNLLVDDPFYEKTLPEMLGRGFKPQGIRQTATYGKPDNLNPLSEWGQVHEWISLSSIGVSEPKFGFEEIYSPNAAIKVEEKLSEDGNAWEYWIHLRDGLQWEPLSQEMFPDGFTLSSHFLKPHKITAHDFKRRYDLLMNPFITAPVAVILRQFYQDIVDFKVLDDLTFVVSWKTYPVKNEKGEIERRPKYRSKLETLALSPLASFLYLYYPDGKKIIENDEAEDAYRTSSTFAEVFQEHFGKNVIPSAGPFRFVSMTDEGIHFERNNHYYDPLGALVEGLDISFKQTDDLVYQAFKQGALDQYLLVPDKIADLSAFLDSNEYKEQEKNGLKINRLDYIARQFSYIGWNLKNPLFNNKNVRRALTLAIDRNRIIRQTLHGMGVEIAGPFFPTSENNDQSIKPWPYDPELAKKILKEEGFQDLDGDGILEKVVDGKKQVFEFKLTYFVKNGTTKAIVEYIATALKEIGIKCNLNGVDIADLTQTIEDKSFDSYVLAWGYGAPPEDLSQQWSSSGANQKGSSNTIGFQNGQVDEIIEKLNFEYDKKRRLELYHRFLNIIHEEQPYTFLFVPKTAIVYREYLKNVFIPRDRQDLIPGATVAEPISSVFYLDKNKE